MTPPPIPRSSVRKQGMPLGAVIPVFMAVFLTVTIIATAITFIMPEWYSGTAKVKVDVTEEQAGRYFIQTEFEIIQSQVVLAKVIDKLNLDVEWGKKYFNGETLKPAESLQILKARLSLSLVRHTRLIAITVYSDDRNEAARIANAIAVEYQDFYLKKQPADAPGQHVSNGTVVTITDAAEPAARPSKPNKPLNIALGALMGIVLGSVIAGLVGWFSRR